VLRDVIDFLICPHCGDDLALDEKSVKCRRGHVFDVARQGYVNLLGAAAKPDAGDNSSMVMARDVFLGAGHFAPLVQQVAETAERAMSSTGGGCIVDVGAGTAHYLAEVLNRQPTRVGLALDVSKYAVRRAARAHPRAGAVVCDTWHALPVRKDSAALLINMFAPRNGAEFRRILASDGALVVVVPTDRHLEELVSTLDLVTVDEHKAERVHDQLDPYFDEVTTSVCEFSMTLGHEDIVALVAMGPSAWHVDVDAIGERVNDLALPLSVTASVEVSAYRGSVTRA
jgi:23S rRNA (guanine745-N1)-methyltransferase